MAEVGFNGDLQIATLATPTVLVDLTAFVKSVKFSRNGETFDVTTFGNSAKKWIKGLTDAQMDVEFFHHATPWTQLQNLLTYASGGVSWQFGPSGSTAGNVKISQVGTLNTGTGVGLVCDKVDGGADVGAVSMLSASFKVSGAPTFGTY